MTNTSKISKRLIERQTKTVNAKYQTLFNEFTAFANENSCSLFGQYFMHKSVIDKKNEIIRKWTIFVHRINKNPKYLIKPNVDDLVLKLQELIKNHRRDVWMHYFSYQIEAQYGISEVDPKEVNYYYESGIEVNDACVKLVMNI